MVLERDGISSIITLRLFNICIPILIELFKVSQTNFHFDKMFDSHKGSSGNKWQSENYSICNGLEAIHLLLQYFV